jgi:hypothetical protein
VDLDHVAVSVGAALDLRLGAVEPAPHLLDERRADLVELRLAGLEGLAPVLQTPDP